MTNFFGEDSQVFIRFTVSERFIVNGPHEQAVVVRLRVQSEGTAAEKQEEGGNSKHGRKLREYLPLRYD